MQRLVRSSGLACSTRAFSSSSESSFANAPVTAASKVMPRMSEFRMRDLFFRFNGDQAMPCLPLLIRILPVGHLKKEMVVGGRLMIVAQMIVGRRALEIHDGK